MKPKAPFKLGFMDIIPEASPKSLTSKNIFYNYLLIIDAYSKISKHYGMERINTEEVMDKLDMFRAGFVKLDEFGWWALEIISADAGIQFTSMESQEESQTHVVRLALAARGIRK